MIMTFDFIMFAWRDDSLMKKLTNCMELDVDSEVCTALHRIQFHSKDQTVEVYPISDDCEFHSKIIPMRISFSALKNMLNKDFDHIADGDAIDLYRNEPYRFR